MVRIVKNKKIQKIDSTIKNFILSLLVTVFLLGNTVNAELSLGKPVKSVGSRYNTLQLVTRTMEAFPQCLKYCVVGIELRMKVTPVSVKFYFVPRVEHHMAAYHVMTSDRFPLEPYKEWAAIAGRLQKIMLDLTANYLGMLPGIDGINESGGQLTRYGQRGEHQATSFKEGEVMGHPVAILPSLLDGQGNLKDFEWGSSGTPNNSNGGPNQQEQDQANGVFIQFVENWSQWAALCFLKPLSCPFIQPLLPYDLITAFLNVQEAIKAVIAAFELLADVIDFVNMAKEIYELAQAIGDAQFGVSAGVRIDRLLCPNDVDVFYPYYLSGADALIWRAGYPINDAHKTTTLLNPFSEDRVGRQGELWGHLYPRSGFLNHDHPGKTAPVIALRSIHLLPDEDVKYRAKTTVKDIIASDTGVVGEWQAVSPKPTDYCVSDITKLPIQNDEAGGYAYNFWPKYTCPLSEVGSVIAYFPIRVCFDTSK